jgi:hypothetical protein
MPYYTTTTKATGTYELVIPKFQLRPGSYKLFVEGHRKQDVNSNNA